MLYILAIVLPPLAVLLTGRPLTAGLNCLLTICFWIPGVIHAFLVVNEHKGQPALRPHGPLTSRGLVKRTDSTAALAVNSVIRNVRWKKARGGIG